jgi:hypothetical protein
MKKANTTANPSIPFTNPKTKRNIARQAMKILSELIYHETHLTYRKSA